MACSAPYRVKTHGGTGTRLYGIWTDMRSRCRLQSNPMYGYYGGRGIAVCEEWDLSYEVFREWAVENGYSQDLEIDRKDVNGNYEPSNCRWANRRQQMANTRKRKNAVTSRFKGVSWNAANKNWRVQAGSRGKVINGGSYKSELKAALAYDELAYRLHGEYARVNFPERVAFLHGGASC